MNYAILALGSNIKNPERQIRIALRALRELPHSAVLHSAPLLFNPAWGRKALPPYVNTTVLIATRLQPIPLLRACQTLETLHGRYRTVPNGSRTLDIDIIMYGKRALNHPMLRVPHPNYQDRAFVTEPLKVMLNEKPNFIKAFSALD
jgi:2-amino-4-hydroxy-6-hydroxymethyldihydropteridine diphosphokinase